MNLIRELYKNNPISRNGESIYEIIRSEDNLPIGIAVADIEESRLHFHKYTHEWYLVLEGKGKIVLDEEEVFVEKDFLIYIKPETKHKAKNTGKSKFKILVITYPPWSKEDHYEIK